MFDPASVRISGPLAPHVDGFWHESMRLGYAPSSGAGLLWVAAHLSRWLEDIRDSPPADEASHFGGTRNPMIMSWPARIKDKGGLRSQFLHVIDIVPTLYELCGITQPTQLNGVQQKPIEGTSFVATFDDVGAPNRRHKIGDRPREAVEQFLEGHRRSCEVGGLLTEHLDERDRIEVEQVAQELVGELRLHTVG